MRLVPRNMKRGAVASIRTEIKQKRENVDIDGPELHLGLSRSFASRRTKEAPVFLELTAFPPDEDFAKTKRSRK